MAEEGPAATALDSGLLSAPTQSEVVVKSEADGPLEVEERGGGPPMPPTGVQGATDAHGSDVPLKPAPSDTLSMPGTAHELDVKPENPSGPPLSADVAQPLDQSASEPIDAKPMDVDSTTTGAPAQQHLPTMPTPPHSPGQPAALSEDVPSSNGKRTADFDDAKQ